MSTDYLKDPDSPFKSERADGLEASGQPADSLTYESFFGLKEKPFSLESDPRFVYDSPAHAAARKSLLAGIRRREGLLVLTGEIGTGKTTLCRTVLRELGANTYSSIVLDPFAAREDLLKMLLIDFGVMSIHDLTASRFQRVSRTELGYLLSEFLESLHRDAFAVVIIDEAQHLALPLIEETRILFDTFGAKGRLQILFVGQPELHGKLKLPEMRQVDQRICGYHRLAPMSRESVAGYIQHRLQAAGGARDRTLFPETVIDVLHQRTGGVARLVNRVGDRALQLAYERQAHIVNQEILDAALLEVGSVTLLPTWDAIVFGEPQRASASPAAPRPAPRSTASHPQSDDAREFQEQMEEWVARDSASPPVVPAPVDTVVTPEPFAQPKPAVDLKELVEPKPIVDAKPPVDAKPVVDPKPAAEAKPHAEPKPVDTKPVDPTPVDLKTVSAKPVDSKPVDKLAESKFPLEPKARTPVADPLPTRHLPPHPVRPAAKSTAGSRLQLPAAWPLWAVRSAIAAGVLVATGLVMLVAPLLSGSRTPPTLPPPPPAPERVSARIDVPQPPSVNAGSAQFLVNVGVFAREPAEDLIDTLGDAGLPAVLRRIRQTEMRQIVLGPFATRGAAIMALRRLQGLGGFADAAVFDSTDESLSQ